MKPVVHYIGDVQFDTYEYEGKLYNVAYCRAVDHPKLGCQKVRTSTVIKKEEDGTFETLNTIYKPYTEGN